jgi:biopolymer transport protein ExbB
MTDVSMLAAEVNFLHVLVVEGGAIGWLLWFISIIVVALAIHYFLTIRRMNILPPLTLDQIREMFDAKQYREAIDQTAEQSDFLSYTIHAALSEAPHGYGAMERAMEEAAEERTTKMLRSIEWLNLIGNIGPMLGLLGTVWGMIGAFFTIVQLGSPDPAALAGDIGVALVTTLLGLGVSIPALSVYAIMRNRIDALTSEAVLTAQELISTFRPARKK